MNWLEPWSAVAGEEKQRLANELHFELCSRHVLYGVILVVLGRNSAADDILVELQQGKHQLAVVHLTWKKEHRPEWPSTVLYTDWDDFVQNRMQIDNFGY